MDIECYPNVKEDEVISKDPPSIGPEGENITLPTPDSTTPELPQTYSTGEDGTSNQNEVQKESKIQTLKRLVVGKTKSKNEEDKQDSINKEDKSRSSRALRKSLSRVFSVSSSSLGRVWSSFSATRIHSEGESGQNQTKTFGKTFGKKNKQGNENKLGTVNTEPKSHTLGTVNTEPKSHTLGRRLSATFRNAFGRSKET